MLVIDDITQGIARVYLLPEDVDRRLIPRGDANLRKARLRLLPKLDLSPSTWHGEVGSSSQSPGLNGTGHDGNDQSLLQLFNSIPSPSPRPDLVEDPYVQQYMYDLLDSNVEGLRTELYPYQRRSAALMLQREPTLVKFSILD